MTLNPPKWWLDKLPDLVNELKPPERILDMGKKKDHKYGSPYDPKNPGHVGFGGKIKRPSEQETRQFGNIRGCGDPNCASCNPETANRSSGRSIDIEVSMPRGGRFTSGRSPFAEMQERMMAQIVSEAFASGGVVGGDGTPASLKKAREAVKDYIVEAPQQAFDDIAGNEDALEQLRDAITAPVHHKDLYAAYGMTMPKGALLSGPPGCGKTMFARAAAFEMRKLYGKTSEFISISGSELQSMYVGETEGRIKAIFTYAREYQKHHGHPLLVFMDEAEVLLPDRTGRVRRLAPWEESQVATFLAEMDGMQASGAFVLLATNRPEVIDQAVLRDGRCDFKIVVKRPTREAVEIILKKNFDGVLVSENTLEDLVFTAVEAFYDPHQIIMETHAIGMGEEGKLLDFGGKNFCFEHIVSGAMAASVPNRAKRYAFARDKAEGKATGVTVSDVIQAVNDLFQENKNLEHS